MGKWRFLLLSGLLATGLAAGCSEVSKPKEPDTDESVTARIDILWDESSGVDAALFGTELLEARFPNAEFRIVPFHHPIHESGKNITSMVETGGAEADLIFFDSTIAPYLNRVDYLDDLEGVMTTHGIAEGAFESGALKLIRGLSPRGTITGLPMGKNVYALYYNKAVFAELGVEPPRDGMTWDDVIELGRRIGEAEGASPEFILSVIDPSLVVSQLGIRLSPDGTGDYESPEWRRAYEFFGRVAGIPDNSLAEHMSTSLFAPDFRSFASGKMAMTAAGYFDHGGKQPQPFYGFHRDPRMDWDIVSFPTFDGRTMPAPVYYYVGIPKNAPNKIDAAKVLGWLLAEETQLELSRRGLASALYDQSINERFGEAASRFSGKHVEAYFASGEHASHDPVFDFRIRYTLGSVLDHLYTTDEMTRILYIGALPEKINEAIIAGKREIEAGSVR